MSLIASLVAEQGSLGNYQEFINLWACPDPVLVGVPGMRNTPPAQQADSVGTLGCGGGRALNNFAISPSITKARTAFSLSSIAQQDSRRDQGSRGSLPMDEEITWHIGSEAVGDERLDRQPLRAYFYWKCGCDIVRSTSFTREELEAEIARRKNAGEHVMAFESALRMLG